MLIARTIKRLCPSMHVCSLTTSSHGESRDHLHQILSRVLSKPTPSKITTNTEEFCSMYKSLSRAGRDNILVMMAEDYGCGHGSVSSLMDTVNRNEHIGQWLKTAERLRQELLPRYHKLLVDIGRTAGGVKFLVDMRADVQEQIRCEPVDETSVYMRSLDHLLKELLSLWFAVGLLQLERVTWQSSCDLVHKISQYEAVHPVHSWADIKQRVGAYRRCYVFTHRCMPGEPVVVLHVALTDRISHSIHDIVRSSSYKDSSSHEDVEDESKITSAVFYSVSATQKGLVGIDLAQHIIKHVLVDLRKEFPTMHQFSSLSPIPGFTDWLVTLINRALNKQDVNREILQDDELRDLCLAFGSTSEGCLQQLRLHIEERSWARDEKLAAVMRAPLMRLCGEYLYREKRRKYALNPVANFHLSNGAVMWRLNWLADVSPRGLANSCGIMVNYRYYPDDCHDNSHTYLNDHVIHTSLEFMRALSDHDAHS